MRTLNPFSMLDSLGLKQVIKDIQEKRSAERRLKVVIDQYREILNDSRYKGIRQQIDAALGEQLRLLVDESSKCGKCCGRAERIKLLDEVVNQPMQAVWYSNLQSRIEEENADVDG